MADRAEGSQLHKGGAVAIDREVDRIYLGNTTELALIDDGPPARRVTITSSGR